MKKARRKKAQAQAVAVPYKPSAKEQAALDAFAAGRAASAPVPRMKVSRQPGKIALAPDHPDRMTGQTLLMQSIGSADYDFLDGLLAQIGNAVQHDGHPTQHERDLNFILSVVRSIQPRDEIEAMIATQMATVHMASMSFARRLANADDLVEREAAERSYNKLTRTFTTQMEALKRYRATAQQVVVKHITVNADQAVVADSVVNGTAQGGGDGSGKQNRPLAVAHSPGDPVQSALEANREAVPVTRR